MFLKSKILILLASIVLVSCSAQYDTTDAPGKVSAMEKANLPSDIRHQDDHFTTYDNGVVHDVNSNLEWYTGDVTKLNRNSTRFWISNLNAGGAKWRLPTQNELFILNKSARKTCRVLRLTRDDFWIKNYRIYNLVSQIASSPMITPQIGIFIQRGIRRADPSDIRAHIIVVRSRNQ